MTPHNRVKWIGIVSLLALCPAGRGWSEATDISAEFLQGFHHRQGTVEEMKGEQIHIDTGENQPWIISLKSQRMRRSSDPQAGDIIDLTFNEHSALMDYDIANAGGLTEGSDNHLILNGHIAEPLMSSHRTARIRTDEGKELSLEVHPQVRSKMSSLPIGIDAVFMLDETNTIVDVNFASEEAAQRAGQVFDDKAPSTVAYQNVVGTIVKALDNNRILIRTDDGAEKEFEVRVSLRDTIAGLPNGQSVVLMIDEAHTVAEMAVIPRP